MFNRFPKAPAALLALGIAAASGAPAAAGTSGVLDGVWAQIAATTGELAPPPATIGAPVEVAQASPEAASAAAQAAKGQPAPTQPGDQVEKGAPEAGDGAEAVAEAAAPEATEPRPRVYWYAPKSDVFNGGPDAFERGNIEGQLSAARGWIDDSHRFPSGPGITWKYDPATGQYYYYSDGNWFEAGRAQGYYDEGGNWHPEGWHDGRWRTGPYSSRRVGKGYGYGAAPCRCEGW